MFDANSKRFCDICQAEIHIGFGGEANWSVHLSSRNHVCTQGASQKNKVTSYFTKPAEPTVLQPSVAQPARLRSDFGSQITDSIPPDTPLFVVDDEDDTQSIDITADKPPFLLQHPKVTLLDQLHLSMQQIPSSVAVATEDDVLARFYSLPVVDPEIYEDSWQMLD